jgi:hypothetical protein
VLLLREPESPSDLLLSLFVIILLLDMKRTADEANLLRSSQGGDSVDPGQPNADVDVAPPLPFICICPTNSAETPMSPEPPAITRDDSCATTQPLTPPPEEDTLGVAAEMKAEENESVTPTTDGDEVKSLVDAHTQHARAEEATEETVIRDVVFATQENHDRYSELVGHLEADTI